MEEQEKMEERHSKGQKSIPFKYRDVGTGIYLRKMRSEDTDKIVDWRNHEEVRKHFIYQEPFTRQGHENWIQTMIQTGRAFQMMICETGSDRPLGSVYVRDVDRQHRKGEYGIFIGEEASRSRGIGTAAAKLMIRYCFEELKLHKLYLRVLADNSRAVRSYEKAGFVQEAYLKEDVFVNGQYRDLVWMGIISSIL